MLYRTVLFLPILHFTLLYRTVLFLPIIHCTLLYRTVLFLPILHCTLLYRTVSPYTTLYNAVPYRTFPYRTALYQAFSVLHCTVAIPYRTVPYRTALCRNVPLPAELVVCVGLLEPGQGSPGQGFLGEERVDCSGKGGEQENNLPHRPTRLQLNGNYLNRPRSRIHRLLKSEAAI